MPPKPPAKRPVGTKPRIKRPAGRIAQGTLKNMRRRSVLKAIEEIKKADNAKEIALMRENARRKKAAMEKLNFLKKQTIKENKKLKKIKN